MPVTPARGCGVIACSTSMSSAERRRAPSVPGSRLTMPISIVRGAPGGSAIG